MHRIFSLFLVLLASVNPARAEETDDLAQRIVAALTEMAAYQLPEGAQIELVQMTPVRGHAVEIGIDRYDPRSGYFSATLRNGAVAKQITGRANATLRVAVMARYLRRGETINANDVVDGSVPISQLPGDPVRDGSKIVGLTTDQTLVPGRPISHGDLRSPAVIARRDIVTIEYSMSHMRLTAKGQAMADGAPGKTIPVLPVGGSTIVQGTVVGPGRVSASGGPVQ